jgi:hypothetical protein
VVDEYFDLLQMILRQLFWMVSKTCMLVKHG